MFVEALFSLICIALFVGILGTGLYSFLVMVTSPDFRTLWRTIRRGRFGLKTGFGVMAVIAVTCGLLTMLGMDIGDPGIVCLLAVAIPLALFIVAFAALTLSEFFDTESTRDIVARRAQEDELTAYLRQRKATAEQETQLPAPEREGDTESENTDSENT